ncbi:MAG TPA: TolC family protein [Polyangiaceae bacterium]|nr:TolC family protein [Polyangiaceae bacterium]
MRSCAIAASSCSRSRIACAVVLVGRSAFAQAAASEPVTLPPKEAEEVQSGPERILLADAVSRALARNPSVVVAYDEIQRAAALVEETRSAAFPTLGGAISYARLNRELVSTTTFETPFGPVSTPPTVIIPVGQLGANVSLAVPLIATKPWAQWSQAKDTVIVARASAVDVRRTVAVAVARAYLTIVAQKRVIEAAARARDTDRAHYEFAHQRYVGGVGNRIDEVRADQQLQSDEALLQKEYASLTADREALGVLVAAGGPLDAEEPNLQVSMDLGRGLSDAEHRPDVVLSDEKVRAAQHAVRDNWTDYMPYLTGTFEPFYWNPPTSVQQETGWQAQLILTLPLYDGGLRYGQEKERVAVRNEAQANLDGVLRQARSDVRTAFEEVRRADAALTASRQASELARSALELAEVAYRGGATTNIEVIDAERTARDAETAVAVAEDGARQARLDLLAATGHFP